MQFIVRPAAADIVDTMNTTVNQAATATVRPAMTEKRKEYVPPDPTRIDDSAEAIRFWSGTLEVREDKLRQAVRKAGPLLEDVKQELGIGGVG